MMNNYVVCIVLFTGAVISSVTGKLTAAGAITGFFIGWLIFIGSGYTGLAMLTLFFILATAATAWQSTKNRQPGIAKKNSDRRTAGQVLANGGVAAILGGLAWYMPQHAPILQLMIAGSLASATADTLSSELGQVYGSKFYDILTFKKHVAGPDGIVSMEGTLAGIAGATLIALVYTAGAGFSYLFWIIIIAGAVGNLFDSVLGATLERGHWIGNNAVNLLNTSAGAVICLLLR